MSRAERRNKARATGRGWANRWRAGVNIEQKVRRLKIFKRHANRSKIYPYASTRQWGVGS